MATKKLTLEDANVKLEEEIKILEEGNIPFEEMVDHYESAVKMLAFCYEKLEHCEGRILEANKLIEKYHKDNEDLFDE